MFEIDYELGKEFTKSHVCAECGGALELPWGGSYGIEGYILRCGQNAAHGGMVKKQTLTALHRQGIVLHPSIASNIEKRMLAGGHRTRTALAAVQAKYPSANLDDPSAALFLYDCWTLNLDPLLGEIIPVTFQVTDKASGQKRKIVTPIITEEGACSLAAQACPESWNGPPSTTTLEEYYFTKHSRKGVNVISTLIKQTKKSLCGDEEAEVWVAYGRRKGMTEDRETYGWVTTLQVREASEKRLPWALLPGNQARVRAVKRWVKLVYPEAKANMREITANLLRRGGDVEEVKAIIEGEYLMLGEDEGKKPPKVQAGIVESAGAERGKEEPDEPITAKAEELKSAESAPLGAAEGEGFSIDMTWLKESQLVIKWTDDTLKTFLVGKYKVSPQGTVIEMLGRLTREQAEDFVKEINTRVEKQATLF